MSETIVEWIALLLLLLLFIGAAVAEAQWLVRKGWTNSGVSIAYVLITDLVGLGIGSFVVFTLIFVLFMMVMGPAGRGSDTPEIAYLVVSAVAFIFPPVILILLKRLGLLIFKIRSGKVAWLYSLTASILILLIIAVPPPLFFYLVVTLWK
jgi:hypothetical protein